MTTTHVSLIQRVGRPEDQDAWRTFMQTYRAVIVGYVRSDSRFRSFGLQDVDADDVVQNVFVKLLKSLQKFQLDHGRGRFRTFLFTVTSSVLGDYLRKKRRIREKQAPEDEPPPIVDPPPTDDWVDRYRRTVMQSVIEQVRGEIMASNVAKWRSFEEQGLKGRPAAEVAEELGISRNLVYQNTVRVTEIVRKRCLEQYEERLADE